MFCVLLVFTSSLIFSDQISVQHNTCTHQKTKTWALNLEDPAVRSICVAVNGEALPPYVPPQAPVQAKKEEVKVRASIFIICYVCLCVCLLLRFSLALNFFAR